MKAPLTANRRWLASFIALAVALGAARAAHAADARELKAREDFAAGRYQQALDLFAKLYAETLHPTYLRNIGRCYQNLGDPDHAIVSFRDYLRKQKAITPEERTEVEGFIAEMEELKKQKGGGAATDTATEPPKAPAAITPLPTAPEPKTLGAGSGADALVTAPAGGAGPEASPPIYTRWWFWTVLGAALIGAGVGIAAATGAFTKTKDAGCTTGYSCQ